MRGSAEQGMMWIRRRTQAVNCGSSLMVDGLCRRGPESQHETAKPASKAEQWKWKLLKWSADAAGLGGV